MVVTEWIVAMDIMEICVMDVFRVGHDGTQMIV